MNRALALIVLLVAGSHGACAHSSGEDSDMLRAYEPTASGSGQPAAEPVSHAPRPRPVLVYASYEDAAKPSETAAWADADSSTSDQAGGDNLGWYESSEQDVYDGGEALTEEGEVDEPGPAAAPASDLASTAEDVYQDYEEPKDAGDYQDPHEPSRHQTPATLAVRILGKKKKRRRCVVKCDQQRLGRAPRTFEVPEGNHRIIVKCGKRLAFAEEMEFVSGTHSEIVVGNKKRTKKGKRHRRRK